MKRTTRIAQYAPGNSQKELKTWCDESWPKLYKYIYYQVQNREEAEDITQEAYVRALASFAHTDRPPSLGYLRTVALNLIRDRWRHLQVSGVQVPLEEGLLLHNVEPPVLKVLVQELMARLTDEHRTVLQLRIIEGYSRAETSRRMGRSEDAVRGLQYRALLVLRSLMLENIKEEDGK